MNTEQQCSDTGNNLFLPFLFHLINIESKQESKVSLNHHGNLEEIKVAFPLGILSVTIILTVSNINSLSSGMMDSCHYFIALWQCYIGLNNTCS